MCTASNFLQLRFFYECDLKCLTTRPNKRISQINHLLSPKFIPTYQYTLNQQNCQSQQAAKRNTNKTAFHDLYATTKPSHSPKSTLRLAIKFIKLPPYSTNKQTFLEFQIPKVMPNNINQINLKLSLRVQQIPSIHKLKLL